jgi:hypothetical protein
MMPLRVAELRKQSEEELLQMADECFVIMEDARGLPHTHAPLLLKAQFCLNEIDRRRNTEIAQRDAEIARRDEEFARRSYKIEIWVIVLIGLELLVSVGGIVFGIVEGNKQAAILKHMDVSTAATASALITLTDQPKKSLDSQAQMNQNLQQSIHETGGWLERRKSS